ncbi:MerR family transcriptional regulator [Streptomyces sp. 3MP-14]|uniref:MerR family transcriptional regulator n=1 Tax=Streptomyces mimosae TaxID=2586635 RepID=A0A5N5ZSQ6_9ACTN|nr:MULTISPECIES: MerR family transcriptional regulator [Streptomyces]KAB8159534.1 MerR family transcriptional regulator [Streptomyces mimosae]KAB8172812.1 MerR family transcriptional regulator [Streptomyces sp. 3MP-14]
MGRADHEQRWWIGELADRFGLAPHVLRHWEERGLLSPAERVAGRRRYGPAQVATVATIVRGRAAGLGLDQLRELLHAPDGAARRVVLAEHHAELERRRRAIEATQALLAHVLECEAEDFLTCPTYRHLAAEPAGAGPAGARGAAGQLPPGAGPVAG